ncbi:acyl carrier protein [Roseospira marina]|uniref:Acyl carrier protein AcpXL n=1 Tax=Roseospira marina TaxID=140057 RepID=A0A5M6I8I5_9PROT|nr:phosphopantetheine-binding protein [Roseospira marina]KAA5604059.1 acyl carrier protein [Roseospira marina]MBB4315854.1 acyl carrier protein [Roseospira marina]MBB5089006.1 acyl carrier protein [Roseospira marina]
MSQKDEIVAVIIEMIGALPQPPAQRATPETNIARDLGLDSLAVMNLVMQLEDRFDVSMPMDRLAEVQTIDDLAVTIADLQGG